MKQVIVVRHDLRMPPGKLAAQVAHGSLGAYRKAPKLNKTIWEKEGEAKIVLRVNSEDELLDIYDSALQNGLAAALIRDEGRTVFKTPTLTVVGIGPHDDKHLYFTNRLKLL